MRVADLIDDLLTFPEDAFVQVRDANGEWSRVDEVVRTLDVFPFPDQPPPEVGVRIY